MNGKKKDCKGITLYICIAAFVYVCVHSFVSCEFRFFFELQMRIQAKLGNN